MKSQIQLDTTVAGQCEPGTDGLIRHIAACVDRSAPAEVGFFHALAVARACNARVTLLHVLETPSHFEPSDLRLGSPQAVDWAVYQREAAAYLERIAERSADAQVQGLATTLVEGDPATEICQWVAANSVDLAIISTHGGKGRTRWSLASTTRKLVEGLPCSVLVVPAADGDRLREIRYRRLLVPLDGSPWAESVMTVARCLAEAHDGELVLVHAAPRPELTRTGPLSPEDLDFRKRLIERNLRVAREYLEGLRARLAATGLAARTALVAGGDVRDELMKLIAREDPDLVVLSSCGSSARFEESLGSVAAYLLTHALKPLLVLRPLREARFDRSRAESTERHVPRLPAQASL